MLSALNNAARRDASDELKDILCRGGMTTAEIERLVEFAKANGGIDYAYDYMRRCRDKAFSILNEYPSSEWCDCFRDLFEYIIERDI